MQLFAILNKNLKQSIVSTFTTFIEVDSNIKLALLCAVRKVQRASQIYVDVMGYSLILTKFGIIY